MPHGPYPGDGREAKDGRCAPVDVAIAVLPQAAHEGSRSDDEEGVGRGDFFIHPKKVSQYRHREDGAASADEAEGNADGDCQEVTNDFHGPGVRRRRSFRCS